MARPAQSLPQIARLFITIPNPYQLIPYFVFCNQVFTPSHANLGHRPALLVKPMPQHRNKDRTMGTSGQLKKSHEQVIQRILSSQDGSRGNREKPGTKSQLGVEDKFYLLTQKRSSQQTPRKLDEDKTGAEAKWDTDFGIGYKD
jgi:hypothetical protein